jgi:hypothetical protein
MGFSKALFFFLLAINLFAENSIKDPFFGYKTFKVEDEKKNR